MATATKTADPYAGLQDNFAGPLHQLISAVNAAGGNLTLGSGKRDSAEQAQLRAKAEREHGADADRWAAKPGTSNHEFGVAGDLQGDAKSLQMAHNMAKQFGLVFPLSNEPWHVEPIGAKQMHDNLGGPDTPTDQEMADQGVDTSMSRVMQLINHIDGTGRYAGAGGDLAMDDAVANGKTSPYDATNVGDGQVGSFLGANQYDVLFQKYGAQFGIDPKLLKAVAKQESGFNAQAGSSAGAQGLMQFMPGTAKGLGIDPSDPDQAVKGAAQLLSGYIKQYGSVDKALAAYNAGPGAVQKYGGVPPFKETQNYVQSITGMLR